MSYLKEMWHAIQTQDISGQDALLGLTQRRMTTPYTGPGSGPRPSPPAPPADPAALPAPAPARSAGPAAGLTHQAEFTHSSEPSTKNWCFHTGSRALTVSTRRAHVSNAAPR